MPNSGMTPDAAGIYSDSGSPYGMFRSPHRSPFGSPSSPRTPDAEEVNQLRLHANRQEAATQFDNEAERIRRQGVTEEFEQVQRDLSAVGAHTYRKLSLARKKWEDSRSRYALWQMDRPSRLSAGAHKWTKQFIVASYGQMFGYCNRVGYNVPLEEIIPADQNCWLYFDIEIKKVDLQAVAASRIRWTNVVREHCKVLDDMQSDLHEEHFINVSTLYRDISSDDFTEAECAAGHTLLKAHVETFCRRVLDIPDIGWTAVSGCRSKKFSIHAVCKKFFLDLPSGSMKLLVYEIARSFAVENWRYIMGRIIAMEPMTSPEDRFRIRSVMLYATATEDASAEDPDNNFFVASFNDTPFDEQVYSDWHALRAPGCCKRVASADTVPGLRPIGEPHTAFMHRERDFHHLFGHDHSAFERWCQHLVTFRVEAMVSGPNAPYCLMGLQPSRSCPYRQSWLRRQAEDENNTPEPDRGKLVTFPDDLRHQDCRRLCSSHERANVPVLNPRRARVFETAMVEPNDEFLGEDGRMRKFLDFNEGESLFHVHGGVREQTASACVFNGGFTCFGCSTTYKLPQRDDGLDAYYAEAFEFHDSETQRTDDPMAYMPDADWTTLLQKKFVVISAPMGAGKTEQVARLLISESSPKRVLVISFRVMLAVQQATRFKLQCYVDLDNAEIMAAPDRLCICANSLYKLREDAVYDLIIFDECGLIRRHLLNPTVRHLERVYNRHRNLVRRAKNVLLMQDGVSAEDVQFYTEESGITAGDRTYIAASKFIKPNHMHPIEATDDQWKALANLVECYELSFDDRGRCQRPFMVFCSSQTFADFLVELLKETGADLKRKGRGDLKIDRVRGIWAQCKDLKGWHRQFREEPNVYAAQCDVLVCTTVIGAGFSIDNHFHCFHAFFLTGVLTFEEERQFLSRLRLRLEVPLAIETDRQSYLYIQKGWGDPHDFGVVYRTNESLRKILFSKDESSGMPRPPERYRAAWTTNEANPLLQATVARATAEQSVTRALHTKLWDDYGSRLESTYVPMRNVSPLHSGLCRKKFRDWVKARRKIVREGVASVVDPDLDADLAEGELSVRKQLDNLLLQHVDAGNPENMTAALGQVQAAEALSVYRLMDIQSTKLRLDEIASTAVKVVLRLGVMFNVPDKAMNDLSWMKSALAVARRISWCYDDINKEEVNKDVLKLSGKAYNRGTLQKVAHYALAKYIFANLYHRLQLENPVDTWCRGYPSGIFYQGFRFVRQHSMTVFMKDIFIVDNNASEEIQQKTKMQRYCLASVLGSYKKDFGESQGLDNTIFDDEGTCVTMLKKVLKCHGIDIGTTTERVIVEGNRRFIFVSQPPVEQLAFALCLDRYRNRTKHLLARLYYGTGETTHDKNIATTVFDTFLQACSDVNPPATDLANLPLRRDMVHDIRTHASRGHVEPNMANREWMGMEHEYEIDSGADSEDNDEGADALLSLRQSIDDRRHGRDRAEIDHRGMARAAEQTEDSLEVDDTNDQTRHRPKRRRCNASSFVLDQASDGNGEDYEDEYSDGHDDSGRVTPTRTGESTSAYCGGDGEPDENAGNRRKTNTDECDSGDDVGPETVREKVTSTLTSFALLLQEHEPCMIEMVGKKIGLPRRWIKGHPRAPRILFVQDDNGAWSALVGSWDNGRAKHCTWLDPTQKADSSSAVETLRQVLHRYAHTGVDTNTSMYRIQGPLCANVEEEAAWTMVATGSASQAIALTKDWPPHRAVRTTVRLGPLREAIMRLWRTIDQPASKTLDLTCAPFTFIRFQVVGNSEEQSRDRQQTNSGDDVGPETVREKVTSTLTSFALLLQEHEPCMIEMVGKKIGLPRRWKTVESEAPRILFVQDDNGAWSALVGSWDNGRAKYCTWLDPTQKADPSSAVETLRQVLHRYAHTGVDTNTSMYRIQAPLCANVEEEAAWTMVATGSASQTIASMKRWPAYNHMKTTLWGAASRKAMLGLYCTINQQDAETLDLSCAPFTSLRFERQISSTPESLDLTITPHRSHRVTLTPGGSTPRRKLEPTSLK